MMLDKNKEAMICSLDGDTVFLDIVVGVMQGDILATFISIICSDYKRRQIK